MKITTEWFQPQDWVKVRASTDGQQSFLMWDGSIYAMIPGTGRTPLFKIVGMSAARCLPNEDGTWELLSREIALYLDPKTGDRLHRWQNPWTEEVLPVVHVANNLVQRHLNRSFPAIVTPNTTTFMVDLFANYPNPLAGDPQFALYSPNLAYQAAELFKFTVPTIELRNPETSCISEMQLTWDRVGPWLPWMKMGDRPGQLIYSAWGCKVNQFCDLPELLQTEIKTCVPLYENAPQDKCDREDMTSWKYFQQHFSAYLQQQSFPLYESE